MKRVKETTLQIDLDALTHNYRFLRAKLDQQTRFMAVVKAFAYGSESAAVSRHLEALGVDYFAVAYTAEGKALREAGVTAPVLVLHPLPSHFEELVEHCLEPALYSEKVLKEFTETAESLKLSAYPVHLKFNTGLNRLGFGTDQLGLITTLLQQTGAIRVRSAFSHLVASEDLREKEFTLQQIGTFRAAAEKLKEELGYSFLLHQLNTSGILNYAASAQFDMVRSGIGLYGFGNDPRFRQDLKPIMSLKSVISQIHELQPGDNLGYNRSFTASDVTRTATIPLGHADGIGRIYGKGKGFLMVHGEKAPIIGNVCMDMLMIDVTGISCEEGDEVEVFGQEITAADLAAGAGTISYELITAVSQRVKREILGGKTVDR
ncbi:alanine racemase [Robertkochia aurantiaca]|uniref:alanine racemase n=1 Tax=Robertkochia aurantiaca TaxID=2873700 RepID=UPI001CCED022|nr:alanine racemase [Robertkochia sp. 3YJGBD-33]